MRTSRACLPATKTYHLHFIASIKARAGGVPSFEAFGGAPHGALYSGIFLDETAAKSYVALEGTLPLYRSASLLALQELLKSLLSGWASTGLSTGQGTACWGDTAVALCAVEERWSG